MLEFKEELRIKGVVEAYISQQIPSESHTSTIHSAILKGRLSFGPSHHSPRRRAPLHHQLPVLGRRCQREEDIHRQYESGVVSGQLSQNIPSIKRVRLSELIGSPSQEGIGKKRAGTAGFVRKVEKREEYFPHKKKKGYEGQQMRLREKENELRKLMSNYSRVETATKLKDVVAELKHEVIRTHSNQFALLSLPS